MKTAKRLITGLGLILAAVLFPAGPAAQGANWLEVTGPCGFQFPKDHGPHPGYRLEWWYYTGNLKGPGQEPYGFQVTIFRTQMSPPGEENGLPNRPSAWRTKQLYFGHAAVSDIRAGRFVFAERMARGALGLAGAEQKEKETRIFIKPWEIVIGETAHQLFAAHTSFTIDLSLTPLKPLVAHGRQGYSQKGARPESASCYYSFSRLGAAGVLKIGRRSVPVEGTAWMDHEYSTAMLEPEVVGWDWFSLELSNSAELMIFLLRRRDGSLTPASSGTLIPASGPAVHLSGGEFKVEVLGRWKSPHSGGVYPSGWRIRSAADGLDLWLKPNLEDQELRTPASTRVTYWEGSVSITGRAGQGTVEGQGYVELTGYARSVQRITKP